MELTGDSESHAHQVASMTAGMVPQVPKFVGSERLRPDGRPNREFRRDLRQIPNAQNAIWSVFALAMPVGLTAFVVLVEHWLAVCLAVIPMATLQLRMYILHHEAAHRLLFSNRRLNDLIGINLFGWLALGTGTHAYRRAHVAHHRDEFGPAEPDFKLYSFYPISPASLIRKLRRDLFGVSAYRIIGPLLKRLFVPGKRSSAIRFLVGQMLVAALFWLTGHPLLYLALWLVPYVSWYQVINRLRAIAEHGGMTRSNDRRHTTHVVRVGWLARLFLVPHHVGYHLAHHVDSGVPFKHLPRLHEALLEEGYIDARIVWPSYVSLWNALSGRGGLAGERDGGAIGSLAQHSAT